MKNGWVSEKSGWGRWILLIAFLNYLRAYLYGWNRNYLIPFLILISTLAHHFLAVYYTLIYKQPIIYILFDSVVWFVFFHEFRYKAYDWNKKLLSIIFVVHFFGFIFYIFSGLLIILLYK
jgi:hypothetical protein